MASDAPPAGKSTSRKSQRRYCEKCNKCPDGFRSEHELRRHDKREHCRVREVWVVKYDDAQKREVLGNCQSCRNGKQYNEDYNACSHLRRMHFPASGPSNAENRTKYSDGRPKISELKEHWMKKVYVNNSASPDNDLDDEHDSRPSTQASSQSHDASPRPPKRRRLSEQPAPAPTSPASANASQTASLQLSAPATSLTFSGLCSPSAASVAETLPLHLPEPRALFPTFPWPERRASAATAPRRIVHVEPPPHLRLPPIQPLDEARRALSLSGSLPSPPPLDGPFLRRSTGNATHNPPGAAERLQQSGRKRRRASE